MFAYLHMAATVGDEKYLTTAGTWLSRSMTVICYSILVYTCRGANIFSHRLYM